MSKFCTNCGNELNENQDLCLKCGKLVNKPTEPTERPYDLGILILLIIIFFPAAIIYYLVKTEKI